MSALRRQGPAAAPLKHLLSHRLRGFSAHESSLSALRAALASPAGYLEIDTRLAADGEILVLHDARLDRLTRESGPVRARAARGVETPLFKGLPEERLARLEEFMGLFAAGARRNGGPVLFVDIKDFGAEEEHYRILARHQVLDRVHIVSWLPEVLLRFHELDPRLPLSFSHLAWTRWSGAARIGQALFGSGLALRAAGRFQRLGKRQFDLQDVFLFWNDENREPPWKEDDLPLLQGTFPIHVLDRLPAGRLGEALRASGGSVGLPASLLTRAYVAAAHAAGLGVYVFSLNRPERIEKTLARRSPDIIFTNNAALFGLYGSAPPAGKAG